jgi:DnaJ-class molecular chaperone
MTRPCPWCKGSGVKVVDELEDGANVLEDCEACGGSGEEDDSCPVCGGSGGGLPPFRCTSCRGTGRKNFIREDGRD